MIVDYIGIATDLKMHFLTTLKSGGQGKPTLDQEEAVAVMREKHEVVIQLLNGFDYRRYFSSNTGQKMGYNT